MDYHKLKSYKECLVKYYDLFQTTQDTCEYVPQKYNNKIMKKIFSLQKKSFRQIEREERKYQRCVACYGVLNSLKKRKGLVFKYYYKKFMRLNKNGFIKVKKGVL